MNRSSHTTVLLALLVLVPCVAPAAAEETTFSKILEHYDAARQTMVDDQFDGVPEHGRAIHAALEALAEDFSAAAAGVDSADAETVRELLPELTEAAGALAQASDLEAARDAFYTLSKPLVRYRAVAVGDLPVVAYCAMARRSWLQPEGDLGNPYYGQSMPRCGEVVED